MGHGVRPRDFCFWLQGYFELQLGSAPEVLGPVQLACIRERLEQVVIDDSSCTPPGGVSRPAPPDDVDSDFWSKPGDPIPGRLPPQPGDPPNLVRF